MTAQPLPTGVVGVTDKVKSDPFFRWADASSFSDFIIRDTGQILTGRIDVLIELGNGKNFNDLRTLLGKQAKLVAAYDINQFRYLSAALTVSELQKISNKNTCVQRLWLASPIKAPRVPIRSAKTLGGAPNAFDSNDPYVNQQPSPKKKVLLAAIDDGCPFAHPLMRRSDRRLRLRALWDQDDQPDFSKIGTMPQGFEYGAVANRANIEAHIKANTATSGSVDEAECYRSLGYMSAFRSYAHGSHSLGMILQGARYDALADMQFLSGDGANDISDFVFVQLPRDVIAVPFTGARYRSILDGILWITKQALTDESIVVNVPYGSLLGPHDGSTIFARALDALIFDFEKGKKRTLEVIFASGNSYKSGQHWSVDEIQAGALSKMTLRLAPSSEMPTFVEIWLPDKAEATFSVTNPAGVPVLESITAKTSAAWPSVTDPQCTIIRTGWGENSECILLRFSGTSHLSSMTSTICGDWIIGIQATKEIDLPVHAYLSSARGGLGSLRRANQSHFVNPSNPSPTNGKVDRKGTIQDAATGGKTYAIGAYKKWRFLDEDAAADYTSSGPARGGYRASIGPDTSMPSETSPLRPGIRNIGNRSTTTFRMNGTSVAAAYFAGRRGNESHPSITDPVTAYDEQLRLGNNKNAQVT
jgi:hypothetical protein